MTDLPRQPRTRGPLHPVTRIGRVLQQLRSFTSLHASELDGLASELEAAGQNELAARLRVFQGLHSQEASLIVDELTDVQGDLDREGDPSAPDPVGAHCIAPAGGEAPTLDPASVDPAASSPKRARWLAEQARQAEEARRPRSRRDVLGLG